MQDLSDDDRKLVLGEVLMDELKALREGIANLPTRIEFKVLQDDVAQLKTDMKIVKAVLTDQGWQVADHERRIKRLELTAA